LTLRASIATADGKRRYVRRLFSTIADRYDFITRFLSYGQDRRWKQRLIALAALRRDDRVLDLASGTGDILFAAVPHVQRAVGLYITHRMLVLARGASLVRLAGAGLPSPATRVALIQGDMMALPFGDGEFTVVTTGYGLRNVPRLEEAIAEIRRVLAPGGRLLSLDFNRPENAVVRAAYLVYLTVVGSALGWVLHRDPDTYRYIPESIRHYPGARGVATLLEQHGFEHVRVIPVLFGLMAIHTASVPATVRAHPAGTPGRPVP
jgi:demethylmenaquinone methyltransferase/2-methoxy-6-polyprenyl-1,4-benzoquinol methylase